MDFTTILLVAGKEFRDLWPSLFFTSIRPLPP